MNMVVSQAQGNTSVAIVRVEGQLDGQNYQELISKARELYDAGTRDVLLDLGGLTYISSAGIVALHTIALLLRGEALPDPEQGWSAVKSVERTREAGIQKHVKLLDVRPEVNSVLEMVGLTAFFEAYTDRETALRSF
ncbi:MAG: STAS domain-containing protein [Chloroflexi bacterium]|nr:STAS domain-containing protein [Chloroflexota bacterium]